MFSKQEALGDKDTKEKKKNTQTVVLTTTQLKNLSFSF